MRRPARANASKDIPAAATIGAWDTSGPREGVLAGRDGVPTVLRVRGFRFFFYTQEGREPAHTHVESGGNEAKFWLVPVAPAFSRGYADHELRRIEAIIAENIGVLEDAWQRVHPR